MQHSNVTNHFGDNTHVPSQDDQVIFGLKNQVAGPIGLDNSSDHDLLNSIILHKDLVRNDEHLATQARTGGHIENSKVNGTLNILAGVQVATENLGFSQHSSPSTTSFSPSRYLVGALVAFSKSRIF